MLLLLKVHSPTKAVNTVCMKQLLGETMDGNVADLPALRCQLAASN